MLNPPDGYTTASELPDHWLYRREVRPDDVAFLRIAETFCEWASGELEISVPRIKWFVRCAKDLAAKAEEFEIRGFTPECFDSRPFIEILWDQPNWELVLETVAHECFHLLQDKRDGPGWRQAERTQAEDEAEVFARSEGVTRRIKSLVTA